MVVEALDALGPMNRPAEKPLRLPVLRVHDIQANGGEKTDVVYLLLCGYMCVCFCCTVRSSCGQKPHVQSSTCGKAVASDE